MIGNLFRGQAEDFPDVPPICMAGKFVNPSRGGGFELSCEWLVGGKVWECERQGIFPTIAAINDFERYVRKLFFVELFEDHVFLHQTFFTNLAQFFDLRLEAGDSLHVQQDFSPRGFEPYPFLFTLCEFIWKRGRFVLRRSYRVDVDRNAYFAA